MHTGRHESVSLTIHLLLISSLNDERERLPGDPLISGRIQIFFFARGGGGGGSNGVAKTVHSIRIDNAYKITVQY